MDWIFRARQTEEHFYRDARDAGTRGRRIGVGASWGLNGQTVLAPTNVSCLGTVSADGGARTEVTRLNRAQSLRAAEETGDKAGWNKIVSNDLRWVTVDGVMHSKAERLAALGRKPPKATAVDVNIYGETAVIMGRIEFADGRKGRNHRVFVKRDGQWQLVSHSATLIK